MHVLICGEFNDQNGAQCAVEGEEVARGDNKETLKGSRAIMRRKWWGSDQASPSNCGTMLLQLSQDVLSTCYAALPIKHPQGLKQIFLESTTLRRAEGDAVVLAIVSITLISETNV